MKRTLKRAICIVAAILFSLAFAANINITTAKADEVIELYVFDDLLQLASNPEGSYKLMADIDCTGKLWTPADFDGTLDGNGHAILNLKITQCGSTYGSTRGSNYEEVNTYFAGLFGQLHNAHITNLKVLGINITIDSNNPVYAGGIAGYMDNSAIVGCRVEGHIEVATTGNVNGVGGIAGFGNGGIENCKADTELVTTDKSPDDKGNQYLGGAYACGYIDLKNSSIKYFGCAAEHGYVHIGGLVGRYMVYPQGKAYQGIIAGNSLSGKVTFYETSEDGDGLNSEFIGEVYDWTFEQGDFTGENFEIVQLWYDDYYNEETNTCLALSPHMCDAPKMSTGTVASTDTENGYTQHTCSNCGYSYKDAYLTVLNNPQPEIESNESETVKPEKDVKPKASKKTVIIILIVAVILIIVALLIWLFISNNKKKKERERRARMRAKRREMENRERSRSRAQVQKRNGRSDPRKTGQDGYFDDEEDY